MARPGRRIKAAGPAAPRSQRLKTAELRVAGFEARDGAAWLEVEVRASPRLVGLATAWGAAEVRIGAHWLDAGGQTLLYDGPRSDPLDLARLRLAPARRRLPLHAGRPAGAQRIQVELVAEGVAWGRDVGLELLELDRPTWPALPAPAPRAPGPPAPHETPAQTREWLAAAWPRGAPPREMADYVGSDLARFLMSIQLVPDPGRTLEIGAGPYFITRLLAARYPEAVLTLTNYFGTENREIEQEIVDAAGSVVARLRSDLVDVERQPLPYADAAFHTVLLCEVIEHMVADPVYAIGEIHRVLAPGGRLLLTTPNVARSANLRRLAQRQGVCDPYSAYGPHGRHNREYVAEELHELLVGNGFAIQRYLTRPVHGVSEPDADWFAAADDDGAGDYHFLVAVRAEPAGPHRPRWLYR